MVINKAPHQNDENEMSRLAEKLISKRNPSKKWENHTEKLKGKKNENENEKNKKNRKIKFVEIPTTTNDDRNGSGWWGF